MGFWMPPPPQDPTRGAPDRLGLFLSCTRKGEHTYVPLWLGVPRVSALPETVSVEVAMSSLPAGSCFQLQCYLVRDKYSTLQDMDPGRGYIKLGTHLVRPFKFQGGVVQWDDDRYAEGDVAEYVERVAFTHHEDRAAQTPEDYTARCVVEIARSWKCELDDELRRA
jgi:hypothetical protein